MKELPGWITKPKRATSKWAEAVKNFELRKLELQREKKDNFKKQEKETEEEKILGLGFSHPRKGSGRRQVDQLSGCLIPLRRLILDISSKKQGRPLAGLFFMEGLFLRLRRRIFLRRWLLLGGL